MPNRQGAIEMILERKNEQELSPHCTTGRDERFVSPNLNGDSAWRRLENFFENFSNSDTNSEDRTLAFLNLSKHCFPAE